MKNMINEGITWQWFTSRKDPLFSSSHLKKMSLMKWEIVYEMTTNDTKFFHLSSTFIVVFVYFSFIFFNFFFIIIMKIFSSKKENEQVTRRVKREKMLKKRSRWWLKDWLIVAHFPTLKFSSRHGNELCFLPDVNWIFEEDFLSVSLNLFKGWH
jgi:hypothetical protein